MKKTLSKNSACGSDATATAQTPVLLSDPYLHTVSTTYRPVREDGRDDTPLTDTRSNVSNDKSDERSINNDHSIPRETKRVDPTSPILGEAVSDSGVAVVNVEPVLEDSRSAVSSVTAGVSAALATLAKHCSTQFGWKAKLKRRHGAIDAEAYPRRGRRLIGFYPRKEEVLLGWLTHALVPSDAIGQCTEAAQSPRDLEVGSAPQGPISYMSLKRRKTAHRVSLTSLPEVVEERSYWLTRPLRTPWTSGASPKMDLSLPTSPPSGGLPISASLSQASRAYASCFATPHRPPSVIRWKLT